MSLLKCLSHISTHRNAHTPTETQTHTYTERLGKACHTHNTDSMSVSGDGQLPCMRRLGTEGHWWISISHTSNHGIDLAQPPFDLGFKNTHSTSCVPSSCPPPPPSNFTDTIQCCTLMCAVIYYLNGQLLTLVKACGSCCEVCGLEAVNSGVNSSKGR